jgi:hypothetical protein
MRVSAGQVLWLRLGSSFNRVLLAHLQAAWPEAEQSLRDGAAIVEVR